MAPGEEGRLCRRWRRRRRPERFFFFFFFFIMIVAVERISAAVLSSTQAVAETSVDSTPVLVEAESMPGLVAAARPAGAVTSVVSVSTRWRGHWQIDSQTLHQRGRSQCPAW